MAGRSETSSRVRGSVGLRDPSQGPSPTTGLSESGIRVSVRLQNPTQCLDPNQCPSTGSESGLRVSLSVRLRVRIPCQCPTPSNKERFELPGSDLGPPSQSPSPDPTRSQHQQLRVNFPVKRQVSTPTPRSPARQVLKSAIRVSIAVRLRLRDPSECTGTAVPAPPGWTGRRRGPAARGRSAQARRL